MNRVFAANCGGGLIIGPLTAILIAASLQSTFALEYRYQELHQFFPTNNGAIYPLSLTTGDDNMFYGVSQRGGSLNSGTIFSATPHGDVTILYSFTNGLHSFTNGTARGPSGGLTRLPSGEFFGLLSTLHPNGFLYPQFLYQFRPNQSPLVTYLGPGSANEIGGVFGPGEYDGTGNLYGITTSDGTEQFGSITRTTTNGEFTTLASFHGTNGYAPCPLTRGMDGNFYGVTPYGGPGITNSSTQIGDGTIFKVTPNGIITTLVFFNGTNGRLPYTQLTLAKNGTFYGTTGLGGAHNRGTVFRFTTAGTFELLASFDGTNGIMPYSRMFEGPDGRFYGTTGYISHPEETYYYGTLYSVTTNGVISTVARFDGTNAVLPVAHFCLGADGNIYGASADFTTTLNGNVGLFFRLAQTPEITSLSPTANGIALQWTAFTNGLYRVEWKPSLQTTSWTALPPNVTATGNSASFTNTAPNSITGFYRVVLLP